MLTGKNCAERSSTLESLYGSTCNYFCKKKIRERSCPDLRGWVEGRDHWVPGRPGRKHTPSSPGSTHPALSATQQRSDLRVRQPVRNITSPHFTTKNKYNHKEHIYLEYHSVYTLVPIGTPRLPQLGVFIPPNQRGEGNTCLRVRGSQFGRLEKKPSNLSNQWVQPLHGGVKLH
jgi:hypothetical protein